MSIGDQTVAHVQVSKFYLNSTSQFYKVGYRQARDLIGSPCAGAIRDNLTQNYV